MQKQTFYQLDTLGSIREWSIYVRDNGNDSDIIINAGLKDGQKIETITNISEGKNIGKKNQTNHYQQAVADAQTEINRKVKKGYVDNILNIKGKSDTLTIKDPMKAETYHPTGFLKDGSMKKGSYTLDGKVGSKKAKDEVISRNKLVELSRKLDGWRIRIKVSKSGVIFYTSSGDVTLSFPHIEKHVQEVFNKNIAYWESKYGVTEYILDGEIYRHELKGISNENGNLKAIFEPNYNGFQLTASACGSTVNLTPEKLFLRSLMQFHIFDVVSEDENVLYSTRKKIAKYFVDGKNVVEVEGINILATESNIELYMQQFLNEGYEGLMIKNPNMPYEFKRSKHIYKYKPLMDDEFQIVGFTKSITGETLGSIECIMPDGVTKFYANPIYDLGSDKIKKEIWDNQSDYIGKWVTIIYLEMTADGVPRHGRAKSFRKGKSKD